MNKQYTQIDFMYLILEYEIQKLSVTDQNRLIRSTGFKGLAIRKKIEQRQIDQVTLLELIKKLGLEDKINSEELANLNALQYLLDIMLGRIIRKEYAELDNEVLYSCSYASQLFINKIKLFELYKLFDNYLFDEARLFRQTINYTLLNENELALLSIFDLNMNSYRNFGTHQYKTKLETKNIDEKIKGIYFNALGHAELLNGNYYDAAILIEKANSIFTAHHIKNRLASCIFNRGLIKTRIHEENYLNDFQQAILLTENLIDWKYFVKEFEICKRVFNTYKEVNSIDFKDFAYDDKRLIFWDNLYKYENDKRVIDIDKNTLKKLKKFLQNYPGRFFSIENYVLEKKMLCKIIINLENCLISKRTFLIKYLNF